MDYSNIPRWQADWPLYTGPRDAERDAAMIENKVGTTLDIIADMAPEFLCEREEHCGRGRGRIVVVEELTPMLTMEMDTIRTTGFITERGGPSSHAAILARALGIPAVSGVQGLGSRIACGTEVLLNGNTGEVVIRPREETVELARNAAGDTMRSPDPVEPVPGFEVMANISLATEMPARIEAGISMSVLILVAETKL